MYLLQSKSITYVTQHSKYINLDGCEGESDSITLAIGDGANDVGMIQVGVVTCITFGVHLCIDYVIVTLCACLLPRLPTLGWGLVGVGTSGHAGFGRCYRPGEGIIKGFGRWILSCLHSMHIGHMSVPVLGQTTPVYMGPGTTTVCLNSFCTSSIRTSSCILFRWASNGSALCTA